jgi:twitching motility protein PilT
VAENVLDIQQLLEVMVNLGASDLHLTAGSPPMYRINGELRPVDCPPLNPKQTSEAMLTLAPTNKRTTFDEIGTADFSFAISGLARYRINIFHQRGSVGLAIRLVSSEAPTIESLNLPPAIANICGHHRGLVLVTGVTGSGKSSTLAAMIGHINATRRSHIITVEDPIEFLYRHNRSIVNQIELGVDVTDLPTALKHVLRQDPDVILFGELRDRESVKIALTATETGHLVFATLHTSDAHQTINRILNLFEADEEKLILQELSMNLKAVISQRLVRTADGKRRVPACEIMVAIPIVQKLIAEGRIGDLHQAIRNGEEGMQTFSQALVEWVRDKTVALDEALKYVDDAAAFKRNVAGRYSEGDRRALVG